MLQKNYAGRGAFFIQIFISAVFLCFLFAPEARAAESNSSIPIRVTIPAIGLSSKILPVGVDKKGNMDVPSGKSSNVGWYKHGVVPGRVGSAVFDAHVFAAFADLDKLKPGDDIYVQTSRDETLHFVVGDTKTYKLSTLKSSTLFAKTNERALNLITCAGSLTPDKSTYDHRLIVFAKLA